MPAASVDEAGQASTSKEPALGRERDDPVVVVYTDDEPSEPILAIEGGPQSELVSAPVQVDDDTLLDDNHPGSRTRQAATGRAPAMEGVGQFQAGEDAVVEGGDNDVSTSCSEWPATAGSSRLSATMSSRAIHDFD